jgi:phosphoribosylanthranilate isomerase
MNNTPEQIGKVLEGVSLHLLQFHGREAASECRCWGLPYIKALPMTGGEPADKAASNYPDAFAYLLDAHRPGEPGGTGAVFDWSKVPVNMPGPVILAGGLDPDNVGDAVRRVRPYAVDTSSGVESEPGIKDRRRVDDFVKQVRAVDVETA